MRNNTQSLFTKGEDADALVALAISALEARLRAERPMYLRDGDAVALSAPADTARLFALRLAGEQREHFEVAFLDARNRLIEVKRLFSGTIDGCEIHPRIVAQEALRLNAAAVCLAHNHPSGTPEPSAADRTVTARIKQALVMLDIRVLDHIIVAGPDKTTSMTALGMA